MLKQFRRISLTVYTLIFIVGCLYALVVYLKLSGFKRALVELVEFETNHQYTITIRDSDLDIFNLNFILHDVSIQKKSNRDTLGVQSVTIPYVQVKINSLKTIIQRQEFDIRNLTVREPIVNILSSKQKASREEQGRITEQLLKLYPAIESVFNRFNINTLSIQKGELNVGRKRKDLITLRLVDLLFREWTMRHLSDSSMLQLNIGGQQIDFGNSDLSFSSVSYNFPGHQLIFSDYNFTSRDSASESRIEVAGKTLLVKSLDYDELYDNHRYVIEKVELNEPTVHGRLRLRSDTRNIDERDIVTRILKQVIGECSVDSTIIRKADLKLVLVTEQDSVNVNLPSVDFQLRSFQVTNDSSSFQIGSMQIGLDSTTVSLNDDLLIKCDNLSFDDQRNLVINNARFLEVNQTIPFITCSRVELESFNLLVFTFYKQIMAKSVFLNQAEIHVSNKMLSQISQQKRKKKGGIQELELATGTFQNVNFYFTDTHQKLTLKKASGVVRNISKEPAGQIELDVLQLKANDVEFQNPKLKIAAVANGLAYSRGKYSVGYVQGKYDSLEILMDNIRGSSSIFLLENDFTKWKSIMVDRVDVRGLMPPRQENKKNVLIRIDDLRATHMTIDLMNAAKRFRMAGKSVRINAFSSKVNDNYFENLSGTFQGLTYSSKDFSINADSLVMRSGNNCDLYKVKGAVKQYNLISPLVRVEQIRNHESGFDAQVIHALQLAMNSDNGNLRTDSVNLHEIEWKKNETPSIKLCEIFHPQLAVTQLELSGVNNTSNPFEKVRMTPGNVKINDLELETGIIEGELTEAIFTCSYLKTQQDEFEISAAGIDYDKGTLSVHTFELTPDSSYMASLEVEHDRIHGIFNEIKFAGLKSKPNSSAIQSEKMSVNSFALDVFRDKRLPDPVEIEKPLLLDKLFRLPPGVSVQEATFTNGSISYAEIAEQSEMEGTVDLNNVSAHVFFNQNEQNRMKVDATASLYGSGTMKLAYQSTSDTSFMLNANLTNFDLLRLNRILSPFQQIQIKSGYLDDYELKINANDSLAVGSVTLSYNNLHLDILKKGKSEKSGFLTFIADKLFLRNSRQSVSIEVNQPRIISKSIFNYWVKSASNGALNAVRHGKRRKKK